MVHVLATILLIFLLLLPIGYTYIEDKINNLIDEENEKDIEIK